MLIKSEIYQCKSFHIVDQSLNISSNSILIDQQESLKDRLKTKTKLSFLYRSHQYTKGKDLIFNKFDEKSCLREIFLLDLCEDFFQIKTSNNIIMIHFIG